MLTARIVIVGSEILEGRVDEANLRTICDPLRRAGVRVDRAVVVPDDAAAITGEVTGALEAPRPRLLVVAGGTGGTWDDVTYAAVATALGRQRKPVAAIVERLQDVLAFTRQTGYDLDQDSIDSIMNIALVPDGSQVTVIDDWLVAVVLHVDGGMDEGGVTVLVLPGPPGHCARVAHEVLEKRLLAGRRSDALTIEVAHDYPESLLVGVVLKARKRFPAVEVGSYPGRPMLLRMVGRDADCEAFAEVVRAGLADLDANAAAQTLRAAWGLQADWTRD